MSPDRAQSVAALGLLILLIAVLPLRPRPSALVPPPLRHECVEAWVADCLPGVGPRRRDQVAAALREGRWQDVPAAARAVARQVLR